MRVQTEWNRKSNLHLSSPATGFCCVSGNPFKRPHVCCMPRARVVELGCADWLLCSQPSLSVPKTMQTTTLTTYFFSSLCSGFPGFFFFSFTIAIFSICLIKIFYLDQPEHCSIWFKGAVCKFLTVLKHKNTICLQIFRKHAKFTYSFLWKTLIRKLFYLLFLCCLSVFVLVCVTLHTSSSPNSISTPRVASWQETQCIAAMEMSKQTGSEIADSTQPKKPDIHLKISMDESILKHG